MDYSIFIIAGVIALYYSFALYVKFWYINKHTDKINLVARWVELQRIRKKSDKRRDRLIN